MSRRAASLRMGVLVLALAAAPACNDDSERGPDVMGPSPMGDQTGAMGGGMGGGMGGPGASMMVNSEFEYLAAMIRHHEEAIASARILQNATARTEMRDFAAGIIETQGAEVRQMRAWLASWYAGRDTTVSYRPMMRDLSGLTGDALDRAFLQDMIPHHMMAVMMSQQLIARGLAVHQTVVPFATNIRDVQTAEIQTMRRWLVDWFGTMR